MDTLTCMHTFVRVVETQSFTKAAHEIAISPSLASKQISWLEGRLGAKLLSRSTRRLSLTETGEAYYTQSLKVLAEADVATNIVSELHGEPKGTLRITCPSGLGATVLNQAFAQFSLQYPAITLETRLTDENVDFTEGRIDFALRLAPSLPDSSLVASEIARIKLNVCAAPSYLARHGTPQTPQDLKHHNCLRYVHTRIGSDIWNLNNAAGSHSIAVSGNYRANNPNFMKEAVAQGVGIAILPSYIHACEREKDRITVLLNEYELDELKLYLIREQREYMPLKMKLFSSFIKDWVRAFMAQCR
ncbi:LysR family transcriptional regulator [Magnetovibrio sp.]|uniref:LysR family transcriptional regulator n=1 Tax=Magnetovibrio sp. TaxID=2024836 RepID=UPI002F91DA39